jgi:hypothetical protein
MMIKFFEYKDKGFTMRGQFKFKNKPIDPDSIEYLLNEELIAQSIWSCLKDNDRKGVIEVLEAYLEIKIKSKNPTLSTLAKIVHATIECKEGVGCC